MTYFEIFGYRKLGNSRLENTSAILIGIFAVPLMVIAFMFIVISFIFKKGGI
jgi:hypothetical protein